MAKFIWNLFLYTISKLIYNSPYYYFETSHQIPKQLNIFFKEYFMLCDMASVH